jgi:hypothetical protein
LAAGLLVATTLHAQPAGTAAVRVDASRVRTRSTLASTATSPSLCSKASVRARRALRNRGFEEPANAVGLPRHWEREPDERNDSDIHFRWDDSVSYPVRTRPASEGAEHALGVELRGNAFGPRGISQARLPIRQAVEYRVSLWVKNETFQGRMHVVLEPDRSGGREYAAAEIPVAADQGWKQYSSR